ncbi:pathogenesis-related protein STH-2-like [Punica granatum]|uniref:Bet v I/Major latex protein domain-containing protein n=2 Tax=Punica granatum TaxID=22663 RepID=A0A218XUA1_PUNGR|nr:pathogenesis-related protein STH-2-like [Punica granatum]OWM88121.1 hypothetical protein CDL15_Pgr016694 [Punica granatum]PKI40751.1 hypothetical protein CRG98_038862 [Punica granatum]
MDARCFYQEVLVPVSREWAFKALVLDMHNLLPKLVPHFVKSMEFIRGDWGQPGSIRQTIFTEGGLLSEKMHSVVCEIKYEANSPDRCILKMATDYHLKEGVVFKEEDINTGRKITKEFFEAVLEYLISNPEVYTNG